MATENPNGKAKQTEIIFLLKLLKDQQRNVLCIPFIGNIICKIGCMLIYSYYQLGFGRTE